MLSVPSVLSAQEIVLHRFTSRQPDPQLEQILYLAAGVALEQAGFTSTKGGDAADYMLTADYASETDAVEIRYTLFRPQEPGTILADVAVDLPLDESLDAGIGAAVLRLFQTAAVEAPPSPDAKIEGLLPDTPHTIVSEGETKGAASENGAARETASGEPKGVASGNGESNGVAGNTAEAGTVVTRTPTQTPAHEPSPARFDSAFSAAGAMLFGAITQYLHYGLGGVLSAGVAWPRVSWSVTLGAEMSFIRALNDAGVVGGPLWLSTAGPMIQLGSGTGAPYSVAVGVSGGPAVIILAGTAKILAKMAPYADVALQAAFPIGRKISVGAAARFLAVFADDVLIMAAVPSLMLRVQL